MDSEFGVRREERCEEVVMSGDGERQGVLVRETQVSCGDFE